MCSTHVPAKNPLFANWELAVQRPVTGNRRIYEFQHPISGDDLTKSRERRYLGAQLTDDLRARVSRGRACLQRGGRRVSAAGGTGGPGNMTQGCPLPSEVTGTFWGTCKAVTQTAGGAGWGGLVRTLPPAPLTPQPSLARLWADTGRAAKANFFSSDVIA